MFNVCVFVCLYGDYMAKWLKALDCELKNHIIKSHKLATESFFSNLASYPGPSKK